MSKRSILVVEDNPDEAALIREALTDVDASLDLLHCASVAAAWACLGEPPGEHLPALVITDHHLPDGSGQELIARLQACPTTAQVPLVMVSGDAQRPENLGAIAWFTKPDTWAGWRALASTLIGLLAR